MTIYEQLRSCPCDNSKVNDEAIDELINLVSMATCWTQKPCETFLSSDRKEIIDLPDCMDDCGVFVFEPFYYPFVPESIKFTLVKQEGIEETYTDVTEYLYSEVDETFKMKLPIPSCECGCDPCGCPTNYKLVAEYVAGYELIPDCLMPLFCEALQYIVDKNLCDCSECQTCENKYDDDRVMVTVPNAATLTERLKAYFMDMLTKQYARQLSLISICDRKHIDSLWAVVV